MQTITDAFLNAAKNKIFAVKQFNSGILSIPFITNNSVTNNQIKGYNFLEEKDYILNLSEIVGFEDYTDEKNNNLLKHMLKCKELITKFNINTEHEDIYFYLNETSKIKCMMLFYEMLDKEFLHDTKKADYAKNKFLQRINTAVNNQIELIEEELKLVDQDSDASDDLKTFQNILKETPDSLNINYNTPYDIAIYAWPLILAPNPFGIS